MKERVHLKRRPKPQTAPVIGRGSFNPSNTRCPLIRPAKKAAPTPITKRKISRLCSIFLKANGRTSTRTRMAINPKIIWGHFVAQMQTSLPPFCSRQGVSIAELVPSGASKQKSAHEERDGE